MAMAMVPSASSGGDYRIWQVGIARKCSKRGIRRSTFRGSNSHSLYRKSIKLIGWNSHAALSNRAYNCVSSDNLTLGQFALTSKDHYVERPQAGRRRCYPCLSRLNSPWWPSESPAADLDVEETKASVMKPSIKYFTLYCSQYFHVFIDHFTIPIIQLLYLIFNFAFD